MSSHLSVTATAKTGNPGSVPETVFKGSRYFHGYASAHQPVIEASNTMTDFEWGTGKLEGESEEKKGITVL